MSAQEHSGVLGTTPENSGALMSMVTWYYATYECQAFHICANDGNSGLTKFSFLCPNGTLFQQQYFVCDWWFNVDCSTTQDFWSLNDEIAAERQASESESISLSIKTILFSFVKIGLTSEPLLSVPLKVSDHN